MKFLFTISIFFIAASSCVNRSSGWSTYRGDDGRNAYSALDQINKDNVSKLRVAWTFRTGDNGGKSTIECNPLIIDGTLYGVSPKLKAFALDAKTGKQKWIYDPFEKGSQQGGVMRGLSYWKEGNEGRIFLCAGSKLIALNAATGIPFDDFGEKGFVDLRKGLRDDSEIEKYHIENTSPGVVYRDMIIVGSSLGETYNTLPGDIRAYNVRTGKLQWSFHTIPHPGEKGYDTWPADAYKNTGGVNAWSGLSIDRKRGMLFAATGAPGFDFHGGQRKGNNLFANCVIALDAATGKYIWHFQVSHHDLWDYDLPSPPNLVTIDKNGQQIDAVVQITKQGWIFVLDREKGTPIYPVDERPVSISLMDDERASATQPFPSFFEPVALQHFDTTQITNISDSAHEYVKHQVEGYNFGNIYTPPSLNGTVQRPGFRGGFEWSGAAIDEKNGVLYAGANEIANLVQLVKLEDEDAVARLPMMKAGVVVYQQNCAPCHGSDRKGGGPYPSLVDIKKKLSPAAALETIEKGRNKMPSFAGLPASHKEALLSFLFGLKKEQLPHVTVSANEKNLKMPPGEKKYKIKGYIQLKDQSGYPGTKPPWGTLNALDLKTGKLIWKRSLGEFPELAKRGIHETGTQLFGGGIVTAGGILFIGASQDEKFRAIDVSTGKTLWEYQLPAGGYATPATYEIDGKQYVVIAAGGGGFQVTKTGDYYVAFCLED
jgi:quinoprotein glucose dehydrogenase